MKNKLFTYFKISIAFALSISLFGCEDDSDIKLNAEEESDRRYKSDGDSYYIYQQNSRLKGTITSTITGSVSNIDETDSTDLPEELFGEYDFINIEFIDENLINLTRSSYSIEVDPDYNLLEKWVSKCKIIEGSKSSFENGGTIKLEILNLEEENGSYSVLSKAVFSKILNCNPENSSIELSQNNIDLLCNKNEIIWKSKNKMIGELSYFPEYKEFLKNYKK
jgi:hypothetical protein